MRNHRYDKNLDIIDKYVCLHSWYDCNAAQLMKILCNDIGPRPAGSEGIARVRKLLAEELAASGAVNIHEEEVKVPMWDGGTAEISVLGPGNETFECVQCPGSLAGTAEGSIFYAGNPDLAGIEGMKEKISGKIVLLDGHVISGKKYVPLPLKVRMLQSYGARAAILKSAGGSGLAEIQVMYGPDAMTIPCMSISPQDGDRLCELARQGNSVIRVGTEIYGNDGYCANLIVDLGPDTLPGEMIILGAHLDSFWHSPGAFDNLTGVVTIMEIARLLAPFRAFFRKRLRILFYTAEELLMRGSKAYVKKHESELDLVRLVVNMDSIFPATARGMAVMWSPEMKGYISGIFSDIGRQVEVRNIFCMSSDYLPFMLEGIAAARPADFENSFPIWSHTSRDILENIRIDWLQYNAMVYARLISRMLIDPFFPVLKRLTKEEVMNKVILEDAACSLKAMGFEL